MANELVIDLGQTGLTIYSLIFASGGLIWNGASFEAPLAANWATYAITMTEASTTGIYEGDMPSVAAGNYGVSVRQQAGGSPATTDSEVGVGELAWTGAAQVTFPTNFPALTINGGGDVALDFTQAVPISNTTQTLGDCLNGALVQATGAWAIVGTTLTLKNTDGTTFRTFVLNSAAAPTSRT